MCLTESFDATLLIHATRFTSIRDEAKTDVGDAVVDWWKGLRKLTCSHLVDLGNANEVKQVRRVGPGQPVGHNIHKCL